MTKYLETILATVALLALAGCGHSGGGSPPEPEKPPGDFSSVAGSWTAVCTDSWGSWSTVAIGTTASFEVTSGGFLEGLDASGNRIEIQLATGDSVSFIAFFLRTDSSRHRLFLRPSTSVGSLSSSSGGAPGQCEWTITKIAGPG